MKQQLKRCLTTVGIYTLEGPLDEVIGKLTSLKTDYPDKELYLTFEEDYYGSRSIVVHSVELETDEEEAERLAAEKDSEAARIKWRRQHYEALKKEFEGTKKKKKAI